MCLPGRYANDQEFRVTADDAHNDTLTFHVPGLLPPSGVTMSIQAVQLAASGTASITSATRQRLTARVVVWPVRPAYERYLTVVVIADGVDAVLPPPLVFNKSSGVVTGGRLAIGTYHPVGRVQCEEFAQSGRVTRRGTNCMSLTGYMLRTSGFFTVRVIAVFNATLSTAVNNTVVVYESEELEWSYVVDLHPQPLPVPVITPVHIGTEASFDSTSTFNVTLPSSTHFVGDNAPYIECKWPGHPHWFKCGGWDWPEDELLAQAHMTAGNHSLVARTVVGYDEPARIESEVSAPVNWTVAPKRVVPPPVILPGHATVLLEPVANATIARIQQPPAYPPVGIECHLSPPTAAVNPCDMAYTDAGIHVWDLPPYEYTLFVRHFFIDAWTGEESTTAQSASTNMSFTVLRDSASLHMQASPVNGTLQRHATFNVSANLLSGGLCVEQCHTFLCRASFLSGPHWRPCNSSQPGHGLITYEHVPAGVHTFQMRVTDTGSWVDGRGDSAMWTLARAT